jgi:hypothetical protein
MYANRLDMYPPWDYPPILPEKGFGSRHGAISDPLLVPIIDYYCMHPYLNRQIESQIRNLRTRTFHFQCCHLLLLFVCFLAASSFAPKLVAQNKPSAAPVAASVPPNRFLFIVDTSSSMERHARDVQQMLVNLLNSGASGQLHRGDTLGVWTFNVDVYTGNLPLQRWIPEDWWQIATRTTEFLQQQHYGKKSHLDKALADMYEVITNSDIITVFLISSGEGKMHGTPFDAEINAAYKESLKEMKKDRMPIVTVLQAKSGKIIRYTVNALPWPVVIPELPIAIRKVHAAPIQSAAAAVPQNPAPSPQPNVAPAAATTPPLIIRSTPANTVLQNPAVTNPPASSFSNQLAAISPDTAISPSTPAPVVKPIAQPVMPPPQITPSSVPFPTRRSRFPGPDQAVTAKPAPPSPAIVAPAPTIIPSASVASNAAQSTIPSVAPAPKPVQKAQANSLSDASASHSTNARAVQATAVLPPEANTRPKFFLIAGVTLVLIALGLIALMVRRARAPSGPSLITSSMDNRKK